MEALHDPKVAITVCCYDEDEEVASAQDRVFHLDLEKELIAQYGERAPLWDTMKQDTIQLLRELFSGAAASIGQWPNSSAYYSVDVIYDIQEPSVDGPLCAHPRLLEVNFMGDWHGVDAAVGANRHLYHQWATDVLAVLALPKEHWPLERLVKL